MKIFRLIFFNIKTPAKLYVLKGTSKIPPKEDIRMNVTDCFVQIEPCYPNICRQGWGLPKWTSL